MQTSKSPLDRIRVASPCPEIWADMQGNDRVRACDRCRLNVYNLSDMTRKDAEALVRNSEGRLCVRFYRRPDGMIQTRDCPAGVSSWRKRLAVAVATVLALAGIGTAIACSGSDGFLRNSKLRQIEPIATFLEWIDPSPVTVLGFK